MSGHGSATSLSRICTPFPLAGYRSLCITPLVQDEQLSAFFKMAGNQLGRPVEAKAFELLVPKQNCELCSQNYLKAELPLRRRRIQVRSSECPTARWWGCGAHRGQAVRPLTLPAQQGKLSKYTLGH